MSGIKALSWNVNGLRAVHRKGFLDWLAQEDPDILCLQETKLNEDQIPPEVLEVAGYQKFFSSAERKGYSGVAIFTKPEPESVSHGFGIPEFDNEGRILIADYGKFVLFNIYFPNGRSRADRLTYKMEFYDAFLEFAERTRQQGKNIVVCGDYNTAHKEIDLARPEANQKTSGFLPQERAWMDQFVAKGYVDTLRIFNEKPEQYSYWDQMTKARDRNVGWRIDYFFVDQGFVPSVSNAFILPDVMGSDHCPVGIEIEW